MPLKTSLSNAEKDFLLLGFATYIGKPEDARGSNLPKCTSLPVQKNR